MAKPDLTYSAPDGIWTQFYPQTDAGEQAWCDMAKADPDGVVAFSPFQLPGVLAQLRAAGFIVHKARPQKPMTAGELDKLLAELDG